MEWSGSEADHYNIYRADISNFKIILNQPTFTTHNQKYTDAPLEPDKIYYYKVCSVDKSGNISIPSALASGKTTPNANVNNEIIEVNTKLKLERNTENLRKEAQ